MRRFAMERLIRKVGQRVTVTSPQGGRYVDGVWTPGEPTTREIVAAVCPLSDVRIHASQGTWTQKDRRVYTLQAVDGALKGGEMILKGQRYVLEEERDRTDDSDFCIYMAKWVSAFDISATG